MSRFIEGEDQLQHWLLPSCIDDYVSEGNPVRVVEAYVDELDLAAVGFDGTHPAGTGRPRYHPATLLKIYLYGYLNRVQWSRRLEREAQRNLELMWLTGRLAPDFKTIADFRRDNGAAIRSACAEFIVLCRRLSLFTQAVAAIDGSKFKAVNARDRNYTPGKLQRRIEQIEASVERYLGSLDAADLQEGSVAQDKAARLAEKVAAMRAKVRELRALKARVEAAGEDVQTHFRPHPLQPLGEEVRRPAALSADLIYEARRLGVRRSAIARMIGNVALDMVIGALPLVGDAADVFWTRQRPQHAHFACTPRGREWR